MAVGHNKGCAAPELVDAFRSVPHRSPSDNVFTGRGGKRLSTRTAARWTAERFTESVIAGGSYGNRRQRHWQTSVQSLPY